MDKIVIKNIVSIAILVIIAITSIFMIAPIVKSNEFHRNTIKSLDDKKMTVAEITAGCAATSMALSAVPGDTTTPVANKIMDLSSYLLIIVVVIFLEKIMLNLTGFVTFSLLIPVSCVLLGIYVLIKNEMMKKIAIKLAVFGIILFATIPLSVQISNVIEDSYKENLDSIKSQQITVEVKEDESEDEGLLSKIKDGIEKVGEGASNLAEKGKQALSNLIDGIAILLITSCVIPIAVLIFLLWIVKIIFNVKITIQNPKKFFKEKKETVNIEEKNN